MFADLGFLDEELAGSEGQSSRETA
jgi:hypothetical protein